MIFFIFFIRFYHQMKINKMDKKIRQNLLLGHISNCRLKCDADARSSLRSHFNWPIPGHFNATTVTVNF